MVGHTVAHIEFIGLVYSFDNLFDAFWPIDSQRMFSPLHPGVEIELVQLSDMVRMEVSE
jgi:hypothetical protein